MQAYICEFLGTFLLVLLGDCVVANTLLKRSGFAGGGPVAITIGWGLALAIPVYIFSGTSGSHVNSAVTIALAADGSFPWADVPGYLIAQLLGASCGALLMYLLFKDQFDATEDAVTERACFCTAPTVPNKPLNFLSEFVGTFVLVFAVKGLGQVDGLNPALSAILLFVVLCGIGMAIGGLTGYAINPARDLGPRIAYALLPIKCKTSANWGYSWIPIVAPILGGLAAVGAYALVF